MRGVPCYEILGVRIHCLPEPARRRRPAASSSAGLAMPVASRLDLNRERDYDVRIERKDRHGCSSRRLLAALRARLHLPDEG